MAIQIGHSLGRYHILEQLGEGGMATVYKAYDTRLERDVAVKVIRVDQFAPAMLERILKRFELEAKALARLSHPNIVKVMDFGEQDGIPFLVMEYLPGGTLKQQLGRPIPWQEAVKLLLPVAEALDYAHSQGIVHRDVKPSNIILTQRGQPMLTDFGIAKILEGENVTALTSTGMGIGTPEYMAPEQWTGNVSPQTDIYALGVVFYEILTGRKPYTADTPPAIMLKQATEPLPSPMKYVPDLPERVEKILIKALAKKPENRYLEMGAFTQALESSLHPLPQDTERTIFQTTEGITQTALGPQTGRVESSFPSKPRKNTWWPWAAGLAGLLVLVCFAAVLIIPRLMTGTAPTATSIPVTSSESPPTIPPASNHEITPFQNVVLTDTPYIPTYTFTFVPTSTEVLGIGASRTRPADGMVMVYVPEGIFTMGDQVEQAMAICRTYFSNCTTDWFADEQPPHVVSLNAYWIDMTEVSNSMFALCVAAGACQLPSSSSSATRSYYYGNPQYGDYPVINVDWNQANGYCAWAGGRLPTEAEWEKAARGTDGRFFPWGNSLPSCSSVNFSECNGDTDPVGSFSNGASPYGALNMGGNVSEWVNDWYSNSTYSSASQSNPTGPGSGDDRLSRSGSWNLNANYIRSTNRNHQPPYKVRNDIGFRCVISSP